MNWCAPTSNTRLILFARGTNAHSIDVHNLTKFAIARMRQMLPLSAHKAGSCKRPTNTDGYTSIGSSLTVVTWLLGSRATES